MACKCGLAEGLDRLYDAYGYQLEKQKNEEIAFRIKHFWNQIIVKTLSILYIPFSFIYVFYNGVIRKRNIVLKY